MDPINILAEKFKEFPGIGERQAKRFVYFLLHKNPSFVKALGDAINSIKSQIAECESCHVFFRVLPHQQTLCETCANPQTDQTSLLIVEKDADLETIKRTKTYKGLFFVLGGLVPIVTKDTPTFVRTNELQALVKERIKNKVLKEIILGLSINPHGEHTDLYLRELLHPIIENSNVSIVSLGKGLSTGTELEYSDSETIKNALKNRA